ncbi:aminomethyltransferase mitochondrial precursor [Naematelia encephala]|uniref:Aminomethyltransferase n=1 Tax=Naematelia encephala TaxID=71784 RepID=A0A1Y2BG09_9TREE|nr:aminomethyltransferase mitochondrial precursor [Naematelia encephala]
MLLVRPARAALRSTTSRPLRYIPVRGFATSFSVLEEAKRTPLYDYHLSQGAKMVPFAGWSMPLSYGDVGQITAHNHVRSSAGLFDVSHMLQHSFRGPGAQTFLESLCPSSLSSLTPWSSTLSVLLNETGGIVDDTIISKQASDSEFYVVTNAGRATEDRAYITGKLSEWTGEQVDWETMDGWGLVALQGPTAAEVLQALVSEGDLADLKFGKSGFYKIGRDNVKCHVARGGYTGEDGFEISIPPEYTVQLTKEITANEKVMLIGLGARDSLRLEAGMCLYGHDLDESISPVEAGLTWVIGKDRRIPDSPNPFPGKSRILDEIASGPKKRRVGFEVSGAPAREGCRVLDSTGQQQIGAITSGIPSPTTGKNIAMGYISSGYHKKGTEVLVEIRKKLREAVVRPMPFVPTKYFK